MDNYEIITNCPICKSGDLNHFLECKDFTTTGEIFKITKCTCCGFKFTNPRPKENQIAIYYTSPVYVSHTNTSKGIINQLYKIARNITIRKKISWINSVTSTGKTILDYGSGTGEFLNSIREKGWGTTGIEPSQTARNLSIQNYDLDVFESAEIIKWDKEKFDIITLWHVLEHIHTLNETIDDLKKLLARDGKLIVAVPSSDSLDSKYYKTYWAAYDLPRHLYHFNQDTIERLFIKHQMKVIKRFPMILDVFYICMLSEKYRKNVFGIIKGFFLGLFFLIKAIGFKSGFSSMVYVIQKK